MSGKAIDELSSNLQYFSMKKVSKNIFLPLEFDFFGIFSSDDVVRITDLVSRLQREHHEPEKNKFQAPRKKSSTIPGSWMVLGHCGMILGQGGVVWVTLSDQEDSCDLSES